MSSLVTESRNRRETDILERMDNVKRLIEMENTLMVCPGAYHWKGYKAVDSKGQSYSRRTLLDEVREEIKMQLLSIVALCDGDNPDIGEPYPVLEWRGSVDGEHPSDVLWETWQKCLAWNG